MSDGTAIEWTDATANYVNGCDVVSPGCTNCYAMKLAGTRLRNLPSRKGLTKQTKAGPVWTGEVRRDEKVLKQVLGWKRPRKIFWNAHGDLFHENVPDEWIDEQFAVMALTPQHIHQVLTKRPERMRAYLNNRQTHARIHKAGFDAGFERRSETGWQRFAAFGEVTLPLPNVWIGTSVEDQKRADERIPHLMAAPAAIRFLSCEPLLGPLNLTSFCNGAFFFDPMTGHRWHDAPEGQGGASDYAGERLDWVIVGGESGAGDKIRPMHPDWARSLRDQCAAAGVAFFFKQWGKWAPPTIDLCSHWVSKEGKPSNAWTTTPEEGFAPMTPVGKKLAGRLLDGVQHDGMPS